MAAVAVEAAMVVPGGRGGRVMVAKKAGAVHPGRQGAPGLSGRSNEVRVVVQKSAVVSAHRVPEDLSSVILFELNEILTVEDVAFEPKGNVFSNLSRMFGKPTRCTVLVRNEGDAFDSDKGVKMTIIVYDAEGRPLDSGSTTRYGILGGGRSTLFEVSLEPPHNRIDADNYEVNFERKRKE